MDIATFLNKITEKRYRDPMTGQAKNTLEMMVAPIEYGVRQTVSPIASMLNSYKDTAVRLSTPKGREKQKESLKKAAQIVGTTEPPRQGQGMINYALEKTFVDPVKKTIKLIQEPAVEDALNLTDLAPGGLIFGGVRTVAKTALRSQMDNLVSRAVKEATEQAIRKNLDEVVEIAVKSNDLEKIAAFRQSLANNPNPIAKSYASLLDSKIPKPKLQSIVNSATDADDAANRLDTALREQSQTTDVKELRKLRAEVNKSMYESAGVKGTGNYKTDYKTLMALKGDTEYGKLIDTHQSWLTQLDNRIRELAPSKVVEQPEQQAKEVLRTLETRKATQQVAQLNQQFSEQVYKNDQKLVSQGDYTKLMNRVSKLPADEAIERVQKATSPTALPGEVKPLTPKQAVSIYKKTGKAYDFTNTLKPDEKVIVLPSEGETLKIYDPGKKASERSVYESFDNLVSNKAKIVAENNELLPSIDWSDVKPPKRLAEIRLGRETAERNIDGIFGKQATKVKEFLTDKIKVNETNRASYITTVREETEGLMKKLKIKKYSQADEAIQRFGEKEISLEELQQQFPKTWENIVEAEKYFRNLYDSMLGVINKQRKAWGIQEIPKRTNYFRHFEEISSLSNLFGVNFTARNIPLDIVGISDFFKPGKPFTSVALPRLGEKTKYSAIGGLDNYLDNASRSMFHTDSVQRIRTFEKYVVSALPVNEDLAKVRSWLIEYGNLTAGKNSALDAAVNKTFGPNPLRVMDWFKKRTSANMISGNVSSALTNTIPFTQSAATTNPTAFLRGVSNTLSQPFFSGNNLKQIDGVTSSFLTRRYAKDVIQPDLLQKVSHAAGWLFKNIDEFTSRSIVAGKYYEGIEKGLSKLDAMKYADDYAGRLITDRSIGQLPNLMSIKTTGILSQFQTEINNVPSWLLKDLPQIAGGNKKKLLQMYASYVVLSYAFNEAYEKVTGRRPTLDPIYSFLTFAGLTPEGKNKNLLERGGASLEQLAGSMPFTGSLTQGRFPISQGFPDVPGLIKGEADPTKELTKPLFYILPPFGGGQAKKTLEGVTAYNEGRDKTPTGRTRYDIEQNTPNLLRSVFFGKSSTPEAQEYYQNLGKAKSQVEFEKIKEMKPEDRVRYIQSLNPQMKAQVKEKLKDEIVKTTDEEKRIRELPVKDRAREVTDRLKSYKGNREEQVNLLKRWVEVGIISDAVKRELGI